MKKKKKLLFLCSNMNIGGFQKSLINLLKSFDYSKYEVDLFLIAQYGVFLADIPNEVNIIKTKKHNSYFFYETKISVKYLIKNHNYFLLFCRIMVGLVSFIDKGYGALLMSKFIPKIDNEYDCCIDYNGQYLNYYMIDKINAKKKITYFHNDYKKWDYYKNVDKKYYKKADAIVTVSNICVKSLKEYFPEYKNKIFCVENIITNKTVIPNYRINHKNIDSNNLIIVTVGRVCLDKGYDFAFDAARLLKNKQYNFKWYWVGPGNENNDVLNLKLKYDIDDVFKFIGPSPDPYYYLEKCDIAVFPSRFEGKAVVIEETKIIHKPIVVTDFSTVNNQIENMKSGIIVEMNGNAVYEGIKRLIDDNQLVKDIVEYQKKYCLGNGKEIEKLYSLINKK